MKKYSIKIADKIYTLNADNYDDAISKVKIIHTQKINDAAYDRSTIEALITDEKAAVDAYNVAIANLEGKISNEAIQVIQKIRDDEERHLENLYAILSGNITEKNMEDSVNDDRLSPTTYKKLKELGVKPEQWRNWSQEEANRFIASKEQKSKSNKSGKEKKEEETKFTRTEVFDPEKRTSLRANEQVQLAETVPYADIDEIKDIIYELEDMSDDDAIKFLKKNGFKVSNDTVSIPKDTIMTYKTSENGWPTFMIGEIELDFAGDSFKIKRK